MNNFIPELRRPMRDLNRMQRQMERLFENLMISMPSLTSFSRTPFGIPSLDSFEVPEFAPPYDVQEAENHYIATFDMPGVKKEDIQVNFQDNVLTVTGERKDECEEKGKGHYHAEQYYGFFSRSLTIPTSVKAEQIEADYKDGVLRIAIPKTEASKGRPIKIGEGKTGVFDRLLGHKKEEKHPHEKAA